MTELYFASMKAGGESVTGRILGRWGTFRRPRRPAGADFDR
jgi:hypothetical protein